MYWPEIFCLLAWELMGTLSSSSVLSQCVEQETGQHCTSEKQVSQEFFLWDGELPCVVHSSYAELGPKAGILEKHSQWDFNEEETQSPFAITILSLRVLHNFVSSLSFNIYYFNFFPQKTIPVYFHSPKHPFWY